MTDNDLYYHVKNDKIKFGAFAAGPLKFNKQSININFKTDVKSIGSGFLVLKRFQINNLVAPIRISKINVIGKQNDGIIVENNYPNPFNPSTTIPFKITQADHVKIDIYNMLGQHVLNLLDKNHPKGFYRITWDGKDKIGMSVANGMYIYKIIYQDQIVSKTMLKLE